MRPSLQVLDLEFIYTNHTSNTYQAFYLTLFNETKDITSSVVNIAWQPLSIIYYFFLHYIWGILAQIDVAVTSTIFYFF